MSPHRIATYLLILVAASASGRLSAAASIDLALNPAVPAHGRSIDLQISSDETWVEVDAKPVSEVLVDDHSIRVTTRFTPPPGELRLPAFEQLNLMICVGALPRGDYDLQLELYGEQGNLFASSSLSFSVVPEPHAVALSCIGLVLFGALVRRRVGDH